MTNEYCSIFLAMSPMSDKLRCHLDARVCRGLYNQYLQQLKDKGAVVIVRTQLFAGFC